ncbi:Non-specific lipid-transfer protein 1 [Cocos nucifera]|uniref:Non-specific lipid-transfer protein 1 n=1 Tax=Cocos nucifera TaxID=13894 RepID=A0A8K0NAS4_COCNU|nr:Non-specific lipid-transfer protein 1 [Cocos nucifera]
MVASSVAECISYARRGGSIPPSCCSGVRSLAAAAKTTAHRATASRASPPGFPASSPVFLPASLASVRGVEIPDTFSPSTDCSK